MGCNTSKSAEVDNKNGPKSDRPMEEKPLTSEDNSSQPQEQSNAKEDEPSGETGETVSSNGHSEPGEATITTSPEATDPPKVTDGGGDESTTDQQLPQSSESADTGTGTEQPGEPVSNVADDENSVHSSPLEAGASESIETTSTAETERPVTSKEVRASGEDQGTPDANSEEKEQVDEAKGGEDKGDSVSAKGGEDDELEDAKVEKANTSEATSKEVTNDAQSDVHDGASLAVHPATSETTATLEWKSEESARDSSPVHEPEVLTVQTPPPSAGSAARQPSSEAQAEPGDNKQVNDDDDSKEDDEVDGESSKEQVPKEKNGQGHEMSVESNQV